MRKIVFILLSVFALACSSSDNGDDDNDPTVEHSFTVPGYWRGTWQGVDSGLQILIEEHFISIELPDRIINVTEATQMAQQEYTYYYVGYFGNNESGFFGIEKGHGNAIFMSYYDETFTNNEMHYERYEKIE